MTKISQSCTFCGKNEKEVNKLIAGASGCICNDCISTCNELLEEEAVKPLTGAHQSLPTPVELHAHMDAYVVGQEAAKKSLAVAVYNHYKRLSRGHTTDVEIGKTNVMMIGPTGSGKTLLGETLAKFLDVPFHIADATSLTEAGYVGDDVESILTGLLMKCDNDISKAEKGIVYIDEIDKIAKKHAGNSVTREVGGAGVQQALLKLIEGTEVNIPLDGKRKHPGGQMVKLNTKNILFILGGSFAGIEHIVDKRIGKKTGIGFTSTIAKANEPIESAKAIDSVTKQDLLSFGMIPEFLGRAPALVKLKELDKEQLVCVLTEPKNALIKQYQALLEMDDIHLEFETDALEAIAEKSINEKTGARGLRAIVEECLTGVMYSAPSDKDIDRVIVTKATISESVEPTIVRKKLAA